MQMPFRSMMADPNMRLRLPWTDVIIDVQGPFTKGEQGDQGDQERESPRPSSKAAAAQAEKM